MIEHLVNVILCPKTGCTECEYAEQGPCKRLALTSSDDGQKTKILVVEPGKGLIHLGRHDGKPLNGPPWHAEGWESVYVEDQRFFDTVHLLSEAYLVGPYLSVFREDGSSSGLLLETVPLVKTRLEMALLNELSADRSLFDDAPHLSRENINIRLRRISESVAAKISHSLPEVGIITRTRIAEIIAHRSTALRCFLPILLDDEVEEVYLDRPESQIYFDHRRFGRCCSTTTVNEHDVDRIVTLVRAESNFHLDRRNPSLKTEMLVCDAVLRFSLSLPPLSPDGLHLEMRRARRSPYSITDLVRNGTLSMEAAAILLLAVSARFNITITGGPGSGKTTLLNALDMTTPRSWRRVYIEDAVESRSIKGCHQVRIRVDPVDENEPGFDKSKEIVKSLHRSPDYLILGEIQTAEHSRALFQAIAAGLHTIQTCHSDSASSLISRWTSDHGIDKSSVALIDLIITMERPTPGNATRRVKEVVEVRRQVVDGLLRFAGLNVVLSNQPAKSGIPKWAEDGAFMLHSREQGIQSHVPAYERLLHELENEIGGSEMDITMFMGERLWKNGHPFLYRG